MGGHYGSINAKTTDREAFKAVLEEAAREHKAKFQLGPVINGWVSAYPDDAGKRDTCLSTLAAKTKGVLLYLYVFHDDVLFYGFYQDGRLLGEYSSDPDHFEETSPEEHERLRAHPELFRDLVKSEKELGEIAEILKVEDSKVDSKYLFEQVRLEELALVLGIENSVTSYEYLTDGEWDGIKRRKEFIHIPDQTAEKTAAKTAAAALRAEAKRLKKEGILCFESFPPGKKPVALGEATIDPLYGGVLFTWGRYGSDASGPRLFQAKPPWVSETGVAELPSSTAIPRDLTFSRTGKWFAYNDGYLRLWDWQEKKLVESLNNYSKPVLFSADEKWLLCQNQTGFATFSIETRQTVATVATHPHFLAWHPAGRFIVTRFQQEQIGLIDLEAGKVVKTLYFGAICDWSHLSEIFSGTLEKAGLSEAQLVGMKRGFVRGST